MNRGYIRPACLPSPFLKGTEKTAMSTVLAIDASNFIARYTFANPRITPQGLIRAAHQLTARYQASHTVAAIDAATSWREHLYEHHKQGRGQKPADVEHLMALAASIFHDGGITTLSGFEREADDLLAYVAHHHPGQTYLWTNDKDLYTCLNDRTSIISGDTLITLESFQEKYQVTPERWPLYRAITGDKSDGHSGIQGLGDKAAKRICQFAATAAEALEWAHSAPQDKHAQKLLAHSTELQLYERLARLSFDVEIKRTPGRKLSGPLFTEHETTP